LLGVPAPEKGWTIEAASGAPVVDTTTGSDAPMTNWPVWWSWELELTPHVLKRMVDRNFTEVDLRQMLEGATRVRPDVEDGRWTIEARHDGRQWEVVVEPDDASRLLVVITAYPVVREGRP
jgi:hypothetical protein